MGSAHSNMLYAVVMEEGCQKSKRLSYMVECSNMKLFGAQRGRKKTTKLLQFLEFMKATFNCDGKTG
jgi:hypothetical protein